MSTRPPSKPTRKKTTANLSLLEQLKTDRMAQLMLVGVVVAALFACIMLGVAAYQLTRRNAVASSPASTSIPTTLVIPTVPLPTVTIIPTVTPGPPPTQAPLKNSPQTQAYLSGVGEQSEAIAEGLTYLSALLQSPDLTNEDWLQAVLIWAEIIRKAHSNLEALSPPDELKGFHGRLLRATGDCDTSMAHLIEGVTSFESDELEMAVGYMESCSQKVNKTADEMEALAEQVREQ